VLMSGKFGAKMDYKLRRTDQGEIVLPLAEAQTGWVTLAKL
jgi:hypothetical protein